MSVRPPLVLTGPPAVGKSSAARSLAARLPRCAVIEVDDLRRLVQAGAAAPWEGDAGARQRQLGARNACALAANFLAEDIDVVITDVLTPDTAALYREELPGCRVVRLRAPLDETRRREATRQRWLTTAELDTLHEDDARRPPPADVTLDVGHLHPTQLSEAIELYWVAEAG